LKWFANLQKLFSRQKPNFLREQGDQIAGIFAYWVTVYFGSF
jgi:hypothetical protein